MATTRLTCSAPVPAPPSRWTTTTSVATSADGIRRRSAPDMRMQSGADPFVGCLDADLAAADFVPAKHASCSWTTFSGLNVVHEHAEVYFASHRTSAVHGRSHVEQVASLLRAGTRADVALVADVLQIRGMVHELAVMVDDGLTRLGGGVDLACRVDADGGLDDRGTTLLQ